MTRFLTILSALIVCFSTALPALAETAMLEVTASYRERIAVPPDAELEVELLDVSKMDVAATRIASQRIKMARVPVRMQLPYDPEVIDDRFTYTVSARLHSQGRVIFRTTQAYPVLTRGAGTSVDLVLQQMQAPEPRPDPQAALVGTTWTVFEIAGRMLVADRAPTMLVTEEGAVGVFGGCNRFSGRVLLDEGEGAIAFPGPMAGTMMACPEPAAKLERDMIAALEATQGYTLTGDLLVLTNAAGVATLRLRPENG